MVRINLAEKDEEDNMRLVTELRYQILGTITYIITMWCRLHKHFAARTAG